LLTIHASAPVKIGMIAGQKTQRAMRPLIPKVPMRAVLIRRQSVLFFFGFVFLAEFHQRGVAIAQRLGELRIVRAQPIDLGEAGFDVGGGFGIAGECGGGGDAFERQAFDFLVGDGEAASQVQC
jgi:hypothetical protein